MKKRRVILVNVLNEHSVLARISGLFAGRGYNIESLTVAPLQDNNLSRITITTSGDEKVLEQIVKQLHKLIPVLSVIEDENMLEKETLLVKIPINEALADIDVICKAYNGRIANANEKYIIIVATDAPSRLDSLILSLKKFKPKEIVRSGVIAIERY
ncbi:acetolactate synthase small subunit [Helicobacter sp. MIT 14-3879]|uniref:acetolactate synthase small subunit n=1 Tax=Helicobacter sp. MIT 14-3879 TaxID=2040649 RepID=UPI000E1F8F20|nr:acetolactate synthase small subunit [Helicobacter sp. MIT 14-3879]RDU64652.1 acetolactate synthase small subunit [Helicobacter sp. MIT 14-3879]